MPSRGRSQFLLATNRGSVLVVSLWMISIIGAFAISAGYQARQKAGFADRIDSRNWLDGLAEVGIYKGISAIKQKKETELEYHSLNNTLTNHQSSFKDRSSGQGSYSVFYEYTDPDDGSIKIRYGLQDEEQKININVAKPEIISRLLQMIGGVEEDDANEIAYSIVDWRDENSATSHPDFGAEDDYYEDLDTPYQSKDFSFESMDELLLVRGMTPELFEKMKPYTTIFGNGMVNINTAPKQILLVLGMSESLADHVIAFRAGVDREEGTEDDRIFMNLTGIADQLNQVSSIGSGDISLISQLASENLINVMSTFFMIRSRGEVRQKKQFLDIVAVADLEGKIYYWQSTGIPKRMRATETKRADVVLRSGEV